jgi:hypothetical protein
LGLPPIPQPRARRLEPCGRPSFETGATQRLRLRRRMCLRPPRNIIDVLHSQIVQIMMQPEVKDRLRMLDFEPIGSPPDEFAAWLKSEYAKWGHVVRQANLKIE